MGNRWLNLKLEARSNVENVINLNKNKKRSAIANRSGLGKMIDGIEY